MTMAQVHVAPPDQPLNLTTRPVVLTNSLTYAIGGTAGLYLGSSASRPWNRSDGPWDLPEP